MFITVMKKYIAYFLLILGLGIYYLFTSYIEVNQQRRQIEQQYQELLQQFNDNQQKIHFYYQQSQRLKTEIEQLQQQAEQRENELQKALKQNQNWANEPVPDDIIRLLHKRN